MVETIFDRKFAEGYAAAEAEMLHEKAESILTFLQARFRKVPKAVEQKIRSTKDKIVLESWTAHAGSCLTMKEFEEAIL